MDAARIVPYLEDHLAGSEAGSRIVHSLMRQHPYDDLGDVMSRFRRAVPGPLRSADM